MQSDKINLAISRVHEYDSCYLIQTQKYQIMPKNKCGICGNLGSAKHIDSYDECERCTLKDIQAKADAENLQKKLNTLIENDVNNVGELYPNNNRDDIQAFINSNPAALSSIMISALEKLADKSCDQFHAAARFEETLCNENELLLDEANDDLLIAIQNIKSLQQGIPQ